MSVIDWKNPSNEHLYVIYKRNVENLIYNRGEFKFKQKFKEISTVHEIFPLILTESILISIQKECLRH